MKKALVLIDIQNDYFAGGTHVLSDHETAGLNAQKVLRHARESKIPVIHVQHIAVNEGADFFLKDTRGADIHAYVSPLAEEKVIVKHYPNSFRETELLGYLKTNEITDLLVCGMMTDVCVDATVRAAKDFDFTTTVIGDACATRDRQLYGETVKANGVQRAYLAGMTALGDFYARVITTSDFLAEK